MLQQRLILHRGLRLAWSVTPEWLSDSSVAQWLLSGSVTPQWLSDSSVAQWLSDSSVTQLLLSGSVAQLLPSDSVAPHLSIRVAVTLQVLNYSFTSQCH